MNRLAFLTWLAVVVLVAPAANAQSFAPSVWPSAYQSVPFVGGEEPVSVSYPGNNDIAYGVQRSLPFPVTYDGVEYTALNVGMKGYVSFFPDSTAPGNAGSRNPSLFVQAGGPERMIAAWWGDHNCTLANDDLQEQTIGVAPNRVHVIQWHCRYRLGASGAAATTFQAQLWFFEGADVIQARYGQVSIGSGGDWASVVWGVKPDGDAGIMGPLRDGSLPSCSPLETPCQGATHFPWETTIQYGIFDGALPVPRSVAAAFDTVGPQLGVAVDALILNPGSMASEVDYEVHLSPTARYIPGAVGARLIGSGKIEVPAAVEGVAGTVVLDPAYSVLPDPGRYYVCVVLTSAPAHPLMGEDSLCSQEAVSWGPDLVATLSEAPTDGEAGDEISLTISIHNRGSAAAPAFDSRVVIDPAPLPPGSSAVEAVEIFAGRFADGLPAGGSIELRFDGVDQPTLRLPPILRGDRYTFIFQVDPNRETADVDWSNNTAFAAQEMATRKPNVEIDFDSVEIHLTDDECIFGEPIEASFELCNVGATAAVNFNPGLMIGSFQTVSLLEDPAAATIPQTCHSPLSPNHVACAPVGGRLPHCVEETCRLPCESDAACESPLVCRQDRFLAAALGDPEAKSCMVELDHLGSSAGGVFCQTYRVKGIVPAYNRFGARYSSKEHRFHFVADTRQVLSETKTDTFTSQPIMCREGIPDLEAAEMSVEGELIAGDAVALSRLVRNRGYAPEALAPDGNLSFTYQYFLAPVDAEISAMQIPLPMQSTGGHGVSNIGRKGENRLTDLVMIPAEVLPGTYKIGLVVDVDDEIRELSESNNHYTHPELVEVRQGSLRIVSRALPPVATGSLMTFQFAAVGGSASYHWTGSGVPAGFSLSSEGLLQGISYQPGISVFEVQVRSGERTVSETVALQVLDHRAELEVSTFVLPPAGRNRSYGGWIDEGGRTREGIPLIASGGEPPYSWSLHPQAEAHHRLPQGLTLQEPEGIIAGRPTPLSESSTFLVQVMDARGNTAARELEIRVISDANLVIFSRIFAEGISSRAYESCIEASGGDTSAPYEWEFDSSTLPAGLVAEERGRSACLVGTPSSCGNYMVGATVRDVGGQSFSTLLPLSVACEVLQIHTRFLRPLQRGEVVDVQLSSNAGPGAVFRIVQGQLPPGLSLSSEGRLAGEVARDARFGPHDFIVSAEDDAGKRGLTALSITVSPEARVPLQLESKSAGCSSAGEGGSGVLLGLLLSLLAAARFRTAARVKAGAGALWVALLVGVTGCTETLETTTVALCQDVECLGALSCDPSDGNCKCGGLGGVFCESGQSCQLEPSPQCVDKSCEFVVCDRGQSCVEGTGSCGCGESVCGQDEHCVDKVCVAATRCEGVSCELGMSCDPEDGRCKCDGTICGRAETCREGRCEEDLCAGVSCGQNAVCSPSDGKCHCGAPTGPICTFGEACVTVDGIAEAEGGEPSFACLSSGLCRDDSCGPGTTCDPVDGLCRCGGVGELSAVCSPAQSCIDGKCIGGDLCEPGGIPTVCPGGLSCDPLDGQCKCGGMGGPLCPESTVCTLALDGSGVQCREACDITAGSAACGSGKACYLDKALGHGLAFCEEAGPIFVNEPCEAFNDCVPGHFCSTANVCRRLCRPSDGPALGCGDANEYRCLPFTPEESAQGDLGYCLPGFG